MVGANAIVRDGPGFRVMTLGIEREDLAQPLRELVGLGTPVPGTCAGMIMLDCDHLGVLDIHAARNAVRSSAALVRESGRARRRARRAAARSVHPPPWRSRSVRRCRC